MENGLFKRCWGKCCKKQGMKLLHKLLTQTSYPLEDKFTITFKVLN